MTGWELPREAQIRGKTYHLHTDFREILKIFSHLQDESLPEFVRWYVALALFYEEEIPEEDFSEAAAFFCRFVNGGQEEPQNPGPQLLHWEQDALDIVADVNKVAGREIRALPFVHWWTFLGWFHAIGQGQLSTVVAIRQKLQGKQKLEPWEQDFYRQNKAMVDMKAPLTEEEQAEKDRLNQLLGN